MQLRQYVMIVRQRLVVVIVAMIVAAASGFVAVRHKTAEFTATTTLVAQQFADNGLSYNQDVYGSQLLALNDAALATSYPILLQAVARAPGIRGGADSLATRVKADALPNTAVFQIKVTDSSPWQAVRSANAVAEAFVASTVTDQQAQLQRTRSNLSGQMGRLATQIDVLQHQINLWQTQPVTSGSATRLPSAQNLTNLQNQLAQRRAEYGTLQSTLQHTMLTQAQLGANAFIAQPARLAAVAVARPHRVLLTALATLGGAILGVAATFLLFYLSDVLRTPDRVAQATSLPLLGSVTAVAPARHSNATTTLDPRAPAADDYRLLSLRLGAGSNGTRPSPRIVVVTSARRGEGKTMTVAQIALALAEAGKSVIAVDANFLHPQLHTQFGVANDTGVLDVLRNGSASVKGGYPCSTGMAGVRELPAGSPHGYMLRTAIAGVRVLPAGSPHGYMLHTAAASPCLAHLLADLRRQADIVLVDSPALLETADAALLAVHADDTIIVVDATRTSSRALEAAETLLIGTGAHIKGVLLTKASRRDVR